MPTGFLKADVIVWLAPDRAGMVNRCWIYWGMCRMGRAWGFEKRDVRYEELKSHLHHLPAMVVSAF